MVVCSLCGSLFPCSELVEPGTLCATCCLHCPYSVQGFICSKGDGVTSLEFVCLMFKGDLRVRVTYGSGTIQLLVTF